MTSRTRASTALEVDPRAPGHSDDGGATLRIVHGSTNPTDSSSPPTVAAMLEARASDDGVGLLSGDRTWTWREVVEESRGRAATATGLRSGEDQLHIGVLLDNVPEYLFWLGGAALSGAVIVGINPTRRGEELASDIRYTECRVIVTDAAGAELLRGLDTGVPLSRVIRIEEPDAPLSDGHGTATPPVSPHDLFLLLFTSGTTGSPKAVRCTQGRLAAIGARASEIYGFERRDICYCPMPLFHGNAVMALWAPALYVGAPLALNGRFSASRFSDDVRHVKATRFT